MATNRKSKGLSLSSLIGKKVKLRDRYEAELNGEFTLRALDPLGFALLENAGATCWWSLQRIEAVREARDADE
ncbi:hypothetical protein GSbR_41630 [Geobacter sp. SVR]|nr:hypothetical protein GSVR_23880 [Geobacter sp. SVR]GCF87563.1 hypothetical protein GSbR_41630 [Geobacter sp. SVR]